MKKYGVYNDLHIGGGHDLGILPPNRAGDNIVLNGDIVDLTGCPKEEVERYYEYYKNLREIHGRRFVKGNHAGPAPGSDCFMENNVAFRHGHIEMWKDKKVRKWNNKSMGSGWFKRKVLVPLFDKMRHYRKYKIKKRFRENIFRFIQRHPHVDTMVFGHAHPNEKIDIKIHGIRIIILPRGYNEVVV